MEETEMRGMGWLRDYPDFRDYTPQHEQCAPLLSGLGLGPGVKAKGLAVKLAEPVDLREWCSPIEDQGQLGSCTANAAVGVLEYFENKAFGKHIDASRLFLYKVTRSLMHAHGDTGAYLRTTMGGMVLFGVPPEEYWPYTISQFDNEPTPFCYSYAQSYQAIKYYRLDPPGTSRDELLDVIKLYLARGLPSMFGFTVYNSINQASHTGKIPFPVVGDRVAGGHAIVAVGYDDSVTIRNASPKAKETRGALLIRNSWGTGWGDKGYGWLPYEYVRRGLAVDWWSLIRSEYVSSDGFRP